jgi:hypothetical protein
MVVAQILWPHDNDSYMLGDDQRPVKRPGKFYNWRFYLGDAVHPACCSSCGRKIDPTFVSSTFRVNKRRADCGTTYDGYAIVSVRFKEFCASRKVGGAKFTALPADKDFFWLQPAKVVKYDLQRSQPSRSNKCRRCGCFHDITGGDNCFVNLTRPIKNGIYRSDIEFGSGHEQSPLIVVGTETAAQMKKNGLKGFYFEAIEV